jgi:epoxyqueuosine reductase
MMTWTSKARFAAMAADLGFDAVRVCRADEAWDAAGRLEAFVAEGRHGTMGWMEETLERRKQPTNMWPEAKSALVVAMNYGPETDPLEDLKTTSAGNISVYARHRDYHDVMKGKLKQLAQAFARETGEAVKVFVDTAPLMEKPLAEKAGLGWQGKHTNLVSREHGSWLFLGVMLTTAELEPDAPGQDHCGACRACLDICPTNAFPAPYQLDARRCISYLTIEHAGPIPEEFREAMGNRIYGCDDCLAICPWNKFAKTASEAKLVAREDLKRPALSDLLVLDDAGFRSLFSGSPIKRIGRNRFIRNCLIAAGNSGDASLRVPVAALRSDPDPVVAEAAGWAAARLG